VADIKAPGFWDRMDRLVGYNLQLVALEKSDAPELLKTLQKLPLLERIAATVIQLFLMPTKRCGSLDIEGASQYQY
jgi:magnesium-protoporphyrin IX monomethyl ester (oxidative) cyclase